METRWNLSVDSGKKELNSKLLIGSEEFDQFLHDSTLILTVDISREL